MFERDIEDELITEYLNEQSPVVSFDLKLSTV